MMNNQEREPATSYSQAVSASQNVFCTNCGKPVLLSSRFCASCGQQVNLSGYAPHIAQSSPQQQNARQYAESMPQQQSARQYAASTPQQQNARQYAEGMPQQQSARQYAESMPQQQNARQYAESAPQQAWPAFAQQGPAFNPLASHQPYTPNNPGIQVSPKSRKTALILACIPHTGWFGIHRMYLGYIGIGILQLLTFGGFFIWWIVDIINIARGKLTDKEGRPLKGSDINAWAVNNQKRIAGEKSGVTTRKRKRNRVIVACILFAIATVVFLSLVRYISQSQANVRIYYYGYINATYSFQTKTVTEGRIIIASTEGYTGIYDFETNMFSVVSGTFMSPDYLGNYTVTGPLGNFGHLNFSADEYKELLSGSLDELDVSEEVLSIIGDINSAARFEAEGNRNIGITVESILGGVLLIAGLITLLIKPRSNKQAV